MVVVSSREFRANQKKYFMLASTNDVVIKSREHGAYRLVPVTMDDSILDPETLKAKITRGIREYEKGKTTSMESGETIDGFIDRIVAE